MSKHNQDKLLVTLTEVIDGWLEKNDDIPRPWIGLDVSRIMAQAAICVLAGIADTQEYLAEEGLFAE